MAGFNSLSTEQFRVRMRPHAIEIYKSIFPGCRVDDLREDGVEVHVLDKEFGIDNLVTFESGQWISIQEKYRKNEFLKYGDFTQEYMNAEGTRYESEGEWFHLGAQLYFYGWSNQDESAFERWVLIDIAKYKLLVEKHGGLDKVGKLRQNNRHGRASFYAIPMYVLKTAIIHQGGTCTDGVTAN